MRKLGIPGCRWKDSTNIVLRHGMTLRIEFRRQLAGSCERDKETSNSIKSEVVSWLAEKMPASPEEF
jgi:hypothetical protein